jgi:hypothetical protein
MARPATSYSNTRAWNRLPWHSSHTVATPPTPSGSPHPRHRTGSPFEVVDVASVMVDPNSGKASG